ncbi:phage shock protein A (PspA) family protein [Methylomagnum ishizawai]|uniref:Phage shock protein A (PspA) family protein n=1 Tax=Methylomagnum ishizawai TaxID=1760988 RepID=A0A1Y6D1B7_9GAMM|nr:PspA/IM30 family protein [Methylomagnum ishizawai]SMF94194.1 phage shock protein A (PspA) family protein [Methylomagnum ishizawai]
MNPFKRIFVSVKAQLNEVAGDFENHEAVADAAIQELERLAATTRVRLGRLDRELKALDERHAALRKDAALWAERAVRVAAEETRALECVRRLEAVEREAGQLAVSLRETQALRQKIRAELDRQTTKLEEAKRRRTLLSSRQFHLEYAQLSDPLGGAEAVDAVFDRWEIRLGAVEPDLAEGTGYDDLAAEFERTEQAESLRRRLAGLVAANPSQSNTETGE